MNPLDAFSLIRTTIDNASLSKQERMANEVALQSIAQLLQKVQEKPAGKPTPEEIETK